MVSERKRDENCASDRKICDESNLWSATQRQKRSTDFMLMSGLNKTIDQLTMANSVCWYGHVLRRGWSCLEKGISLRLKVKRRKGGQRGRGRSRLRKKM